MNELLFGFSQIKYWNVTLFSKKYAHTYYVIGFHGLFDVFLDQQGITYYKISYQRLKVISKEFSNGFLPTQNEIIDLVLSLGGKVQ